MMPLFILGLLLLKSALSASAILPNLQLPSGVPSSLSLPANATSLSAVTATTLPISNITTNPWPDWPIPPFTQRIGEGLYITVDKLGAFAAPDARKGIFTSIEVIHYNIAIMGGPDEKISLPFNRVNQQVYVRFGGGLESTLLRWQMEGIMSTVWNMMMEHSPREILWAKILVGNPSPAPVVDFSLTFRW